ncbi:hypothetical protein [Cognatiyoonia sp. IB215182]|uniref:hypothetical protein n=1 Tax=Cognatiyoonia sp. IB215182 TaxID=3097353 RepID=UPI002A184731|nr:hypothetical protein [Cognatiyoonia sp. IB215182]MDX8355035.1 hypothetical protein [Cognatiyoonia sp. IB215182]
MSIELRMVLKRLFARRYPTEVLPDWEPAPWRMELKAAEKQKRGFLERAEYSIRWKPLHWESFPEEGIFGEKKAWFQSHDVAYVASLGREDLILIQNLYFGFPDPPEWGLASRPSSQSKGNWSHWGHFPDIPEAWELP